jgi:hypothetical protein
MEDTHLANLSNYLKRHIDSGKHKVKHSCPVDISDGPCTGCETTQLRLAFFEGWIALIALEQSRRVANVKQTSDNKDKS